MIELVNVNKKYPNSDNGIFDVNLQFNNKGIYFICGTSGSGKTTLLNILGLIENYDNGLYKFDDIDVNSLSSHQLEQYRNEKIGYIFQDFKIIDNLTIKQNIEISVNYKLAKEEIENVLSSLGILEFIDQKVGLLSAGQRQRVAIARAIIRHPYVLLADEPTGNLDSKTSREVMALLRKLSKDYLVIIVTHDAKLIGENDNLITICDGKITSVRSKPIFNEKNNKQFNKVRKYQWKNFVLKSNKILKHSIFENIIFYCILTLTIIVSSITTSIEFFNRPNFYYQNIKSLDDSYISICMEDTDKDESLHISYKGYRFIESDLIKDNIAIHTTNFNVFNSKLETNIFFIGCDVVNLKSEISSGRAPVSSNEILLSTYVEKTYGYEINNSIEFEINDIVKQYTICGFYDDDTDARKSPSVFDEAFIAYVSDYNSFRTTEIMCGNFYNLSGSPHYIINSYANENIIYGFKPNKEHQFVINKRLYERNNSQYTFERFTLDDLKAAPSLYENYYPCIDFNNFECVGVVDDGLDDYRIYYNLSGYTKISNTYEKYYSTSQFLIPVSYENIKKCLNHNYNILSLYCDEYNDVIIKVKSLQAITIILTVALLLFLVILVIRDIDMLYKNKKEEIGKLLVQGTSKTELYFSILTRYFIGIIISCVGIFALFLFLEKMLNTLFISLFETMSGSLSFVFNIKSDLIFFVGLCLMLIIGIVLLIKFSKIRKNNIIYWLKNE